MNELLTELANFEGQIKSKEQEALKHEDAARKCRADREQCKLEASRLRANINDARIVNAAQSSSAAADAAKGAAEAASKEAMATLSRLQEKEKQLDEMLAKAAVPKE